MIWALYVGLAIIGGLALHLLTQGKPHSPSPIYAPGAPLSQDVHFEYIGNRRILSLPFFPLFHPSLSSSLPASHFSKIVEQPKIKQPWIHQVLQLLQVNSSRFMSIYMP